MRANKHEQYYKCTGCGGKIAWLECKQPEGPSCLLCLVNKTPRTLELTMVRAADPEYRQFTSRAYDKVKIK